MAIHMGMITIDCADPARLASFWSAVLDIPVTSEHSADAGWTTAGSRLDPPRLTFQRVPEPKTGKVRLHLDIQVDDLETAGAHAIAQGATLAEFQPQDDVRVYLDPVGHPFCLWATTA